VFNSLSGNGPVIPICNISNEEAATYDRGEKLIRCKLASSYRLIEMLGWARGTPGYITVSSKYFSSFC